MVDSVQPFFHHALQSFALLLTHIRLICLESGIYPVKRMHWCYVVTIFGVSGCSQAEAKKGNLFTEWYDMLYTPRMGYRILLGILLQMFQQLTGKNKLQLKQWKKMKNR